MLTATFDTYAHINILKREGMTETQAAAVVNMVKEVQENGISDLATKGDLTALRSELKSEIRELELRLTIKMGAMSFALGGVLLAVKFFSH